MRNKLLVIVVTYNAMQWADKCFSSLRESSVPCDIMAIDNCSTDGTQNYIRNYFPEIELIENKENLGFGKANNIGLQRVLDKNYDYGYLLNQDAWVMPDTFKILINVSENHPEYGILSPMQLQADGNHFENKFGNYVLPKRQTFAPHLLEDLFFKRAIDVYETSFVMAAHWLMTYQCIAIVGGFSPTFPHYGEDDNYLNRTNYWKFKIGIVPSSIAIHDRSDNKWSEEKEMYVMDYIGSLVSISNPLHKEPLNKYISLLLKRGIRNRQMDLIKYAFRLKKEQNRAESNYARSLAKRAFLNPVSASTIL